MQYLFMMFNSIKIRPSFSVMCRPNVIVFFALFLLWLVLAACANAPRHHLAIDASLIEPGQSQEDVLRMMGPPNATRTNHLGEEEWHYYEVRKRFWHGLPFADRFSQPEVDALMVVMENGRVRSVQYYVPVPSR